MFEISRKCSPIVKIRWQWRINTSAIVSLARKWCYPSEVYTGNLGRSPQLNFVLLWRHHLRSSKFYIVLVLKELSLLLQYITISRCSLSFPATYDKVNNKVNVKFKYADKVLLYKGHVLSTPAGCRKSLQTPKSFLYEPDHAVECPSTWLCQSMRLLSFEINLVLSK